MFKSTWFNKKTKTEEKKQEDLKTSETKKEETVCQDENDKNIVITIGRELGSGGRKVAKEVAKRLNIEYYDKETITKAAKENGIDENLFKQVEESNIDSFWYEFSTKAYEAENEKATYKEMTAADKLFMVQSDIIRNLAKNKSAVIVGRCATYILKNNSKRIFICADEKDRLERIQRAYNVDYKKAKRVMEISDKKRESYHKYYTNQDWKDEKNYDLVINTSKLGIEKSIEEIIKLIKA